MQCEEEEGEIVDDDSWVGQYCNLDSRSDVPQSRFQETSSDISDDQHDSDDEFPVIRPPERPVNPLNKYSVWQIDISEDLCTSLNTSLGEMLCGPNDRDVESYSYIPSLHFDRNRSESKEKLNDRFKKFRRKGARRLPPLSVTECNTSEEIAEDICKKLQEKNHCLIHNTVEVIGKKKAIHLYRKTRNIEGKGGLQVLDRSRRRTSGGVFAYLIHQDKSITPDQIKIIFQNSKDLSKKQYRKKRKKKNHSSKSTSNSISNQEQEFKTRGELELEKVVRTPPPSPAVPSSPPQDDLSTAYLLDRTSAALAHTDDMQIE